MNGSDWGPVDYRLQGSNDRYAILFDISIIDPVSKDRKSNAVVVSNMQGVVREKLRLEKNTTQKN